MNDQDARFILSAYRPDGQDAADPDFQTALAQAQCSPPLQESFARQIESDQAISTAFNRFAPPADLRANILAGARMHPTRHPWWRSAFHPLAAIAALLIVFVGVFFATSHRSSNTLAAWQHDSLTKLTDVVSGLDSLDVESESPATLHQWLRASNAPMATPMPEALTRLRSLGCKVFGWHGQQVSIVCFHLSPTELVHLITVDTPLVQHEAKPHFAAHDGWNTATWSRNGKTYLLATKAPSEQLSDLLL